MDEKQPENLKEFYTNLIENCIKKNKDNEQQIKKEITEIF
jgi:hypothetical protein